MIVCNATPLIAFRRIGKLALLRDVVGRIRIPHAVAEEIKVYGDRGVGAIDLGAEPWIHVDVSSQNIESIQFLKPTLDRGEAEVIALAYKHRADLVLIDELAARKVALSLELKVTGSVGLLIQAKRLGLIPAVKPCLDEMMSQGIRFGRSFIDAVLKQEGEA